MRISGRSAALSVLAAVALAVPAEGEGVPSFDPQDDLLVSGQVTDLSSGAAIPAASLKLFRGDEPRAFRETLTDERGRFRMEDVAPGTYRIEIEALGFRTIAESVEIPDTPPVEMRIELAPQALELEGVVVTGRARTLLDRVGFNARRERGLGTHFTRDEILERASFRVSDVFRMVPGARVVPRAGPGLDADVRLRGGCAPDVIVDGVRTVQGTSVDDLLGLHDVEAIEVYRGSTAPSQYTHSSCGAILVWTREPGSRDGRPFSWKRAMAAAGFVLGSILLTR
jgi:hypothetical protein